MVGVFKNMPQDAIEGVEIKAGFAIGGESFAAISQNKLPSTSLNVKYPPGIGGTAGTEKEEIFTSSVDTASEESVKDKFLAIPNAVDIGVGIDFGKKELDASPPTDIDLLTGIKVVDANSIADVVTGGKKADVEGDPLINPVASDKSQSISSSIEPKSSDKLPEKSIAPEVKSEPVVEKLVEKSIAPEVKSEPVV
ncbi:hypothetical protein, partial [Microcoleus sp. PH2017_27_LUM_O_A]|uniref:hypothetical protein n=1 Tax=Microcoleus sp. PH2017_27_LUM_O_A TaxID=2798837 RepID=UPI001DDE7FD5